MIPALSIERNIFDNILMVKRKPDGRAGYRKHRRDLPTEARPEPQRPKREPTVEKQTDGKGKRKKILWIINWEDK